MRLPGAMMSKLHGWNRVSALPLAARASVARLLGASALAGIVLGGMLLSGCSPIEPWVKPYEREHLADPIMSFDRNPISSSYLDHVWEVREGARGATGSIGGGCGCN
jgi:hypothetical protein